MYKNLSSFQEIKKEAKWKYVLGQYLKLSKN